MFGSLKMAAFFAFWNFTTSWRKVRFLEKKGGTILGNRAVSQELIILGNRIRECRKEREFSQEILAEKSGVSTNTISRIEGGQMAMSVGILQKIVKALGGRCKYAAWSKHRGK